MKWPRLYRPAERIVEFTDWLVDEKKFTQLPFTNAFEIVRVKSSEGLTLVAYTNNKNRQSWDPKLHQLLLEYEDTL